MILTIDTGNTHTKLGLAENGQMTPICRIPTDRSQTTDGYAALIGQIMELRKIDIAEIEGVIISSVVPPVTTALVGAMELITGKSPMVLGEGAVTDLVKDIPGGIIAPDLEANAVAAKELYPLPCVIVSMGTATTVTVVDENGVYIGGVILPGVSTSLNALTATASLLPDIDLVAPEQAIATETISALQSGVVYGAAGSIDGILDHFEAEMKIAPKSIVATGGLGKMICKYCRHNIEVDDQLLLKGLEIIYKKNQ